MSKQKKQFEVFDLLDEKVLEEEVKRYIHVINSVIGMTAFTLGLVCLGFPHPERMAGLCFIFVLLLMFQVVNTSFPSTLKVVKELCKEGEKEEKIELKKTEKYLLSKYLGWKVFLIRVPAYWFGIGFLGLIFANPMWLSWFYL